MRLGLCKSVVAVVVVIVAAGCNGNPRHDAEQAIQHYVQGKLLAEQGSLDAALTELAEAVKADPELSIAYSAAGDIHRKRQDWPAARTCYEVACETNPYEFGPHYNLGVTYQMLSEAAKSIQAVHEMLRLAVDVYLRAITIKPTDFDANLNLSACYFQLGKYDMAEQYCLAAIRINPRSPFAHCNLGIIYDSQNRLYKAINAYKASLELDTKQPNLWLNLGSTYMRQSRFKSAMRAFKRASEYDPRNPAAYEQIGACCVHLRDYATGAAAYKKSLQLNPNSATTHRGIGIIYMSMYVLDPKKVKLRDKALEHWYRSLELQPNQKDLIRFVHKYSPTYTGPKL